MEERIQKALQKIPDYREFYTVDEMNERSRALAKEYPTLVQLFPFGTSREGEEILGLKIGQGSKNALVFGLPHPNEPIGTMTMDYMTRLLCEDAVLRNKLDYTWYFVKTWDVDGARKNEGWFKGPFTLYHYARNFFRPAGHQQVDWTFPIDYKTLHFDQVLPETQAMMTLLDDIKPTFIYSLHNAGFGGVYWYLTNDIPAVYEQLYEAPKRQGIPRNLGEPEAPFCQAFAPAVYKELGIRDHYDYLEKYDVQDIPALIQCGTCSADYAHRKYGSFTMLTELPYFYSDKIIDLSLSDMQRGEAVRQRIEFQRRHSDAINQSLHSVREDLAQNSQYVLALDAFHQDDEQNEAMMRMSYEDPEYQKPATQAEKFDNLWVAKFYQMLSYGLLVRAMEEALKDMEQQGIVDPPKAARLKKQFLFAEKELLQLATYLEENMEYEVVPIKKLVAIQLECGLIVAKAMNESGDNPI